MAKTVRVFAASLLEQESLSQDGMSSNERPRRRKVGINALSNCDTAHGPVTSLVPIVTSLLWTITALSTPVTSLSGIHITYANYHIRSWTIAD